MIKFKLEKGIDLPKYASEGAVGLDVSSNSILKVFKGDQEVVGDKLEKIKENFNARGYIKLRAFERVLFGTGITVADMHPNLELQVRSRSGISLKRGLNVFNSPGTVDSDYRGEIGVILYNSTPFLNQVDKGERIAQIVPKEAIRPDITQCDDITESNRNSDGFGSTGKV